MIKSCINIHHVSRMDIQRKEYNGTTWVHIALTGEDGATSEILVFDEGPDNLLEINVPDTEKGSGTC